MVKRERRRQMSKSHPSWRHYVHVSSAVALPEPLSKKPHSVHKSPWECSVTKIDQYFYTSIYMDMLVSLWAAHHATVSVMGPVPENTLRKLNNYFRLSMYTKYFFYTQLCRFWFTGLSSIIM